MDLCVFRWCYSNLFHDFVTRHFGKHKDFEIVGQGIVYSFSSRVPLPHSFRLVSQHFQNCQIWATQIAKKSAFFVHPSRIYICPFGEACQDCHNLLWAAFFLDCQVEGDNSAILSFASLNV